MGAQEKSPSANNSMQRVKVYLLNDDGKWNDQGIGHVTVDYLQRSEELCLFVIDEEDNETLLLHRISSDDIYRKQEDTIIYWRDPEYATELALSFQKTTGCSFIWDNICNVQRNMHFNTLSNGSYHNVNSELRELPPVELSTLPLILKTVVEIEIADQLRVTDLILHDQDFIRKLMDLFRICEDLENIDGLHMIFKIVRGIILLNHTHIFDRIFGDECMLDIIGCLEYDPDVPHVHHRNFLKEHVVFKEAIPIKDPAVLSKIHQTYRVGYLKDVILARVLDEATLASLNAIVHTNNSMVVTLLKDDNTFIQALFARMKSSSTSAESKKNLVLFLHEFCTLSKSLQMVQQLRLYRDLVNEGILEIIADILQSQDKKLVLAGTDILILFLNQDPNLLRSYVTRQEGVPLFGLLVKGMVAYFGDDMHCQFLEILRNLLDSYTSGTQDIGLIEQNEYDDVSNTSYLSANSCQKREIIRINQVLQVVRKAHQLTLAQIWMQKSVNELVPVGKSSLSGHGISGFIDACRMCFWSVGQGVVGKAFSSKRACYCRDVKQLSIKEYPMVPNARKYGLSGCFAICLQSSCSNNCIYTLEFFLPSNETNNGDPRTLLHKLMLTLKEQLQGSFKIASGQELGQKLFVEVIKVSSDDTLDSFEICHTFGSETAFWAAEVHSRERMTPPDYSSQQVNAANYSVNGVHEQQIGFVGSPPEVKPVQNIIGITHQQPNAKLDAANRDRDGASLEQGGNGAIVLRNQGSSYIVDRDDVNLEQSGRKQGSSYTFDRDDCISLEQSGKIQASIYTFDRDNGVCLVQSGSDATALRKQGSSYTLKSERGITCEILEQNSTMKLGDAAKHLGVSRSTLKRICRDYDIHRWPPHKARKNNQAFTQEKVARPFIENNEGQSRSDATRQQEHGSITVKATYGGDIIKFQLPFSVRKTDLEQKVAQRLNLLVGSFKIKYLDEDDDWVLVPCDEDLTRALSTLRLLGRTTVKMLVESLQNS